MFGVQIPSSFEKDRILSITIMTSTSMIVDTVMILSDSIAILNVVATQYYIVTADQFLYNHKSPR